MSEPPDASPAPARGLSAGARLAIALMAIAVLAAGFLVLRSDGSGGDEPASTSPQATSQPDRAAPGTTTAPTPAPAPAVPVVRVRGGAPVGGVRHLAFRKGERIRFAVISDAAGEVHLHGYDVERELTPGRAARFDLRATLEGRFEVELHGTDTQVARLDVRP